MEEGNGGRSIACATYGKFLLRLAGVEGVDISDLLVVSRGLTLAEQVISSRVEIRQRRSTNQRTSQRVGNMGVSGTDHATSSHHITSQPAEEKEVEFRSQNWG